MISRAEANDEDTLRSLGEVYKQAGNAHIIGLTGVPGSGKSTLVSKLVETIRKGGKKVGIIAIDPSSPFSGGAILGDRIRMTSLVMDKGVFIRSMATRGSTGGLARAALSAVDILDVAGFDIIIIETVGVGQDEVEIARASHSTLVVSAPGLGDDVQAIKAGILEIADIHVVSKCDRSDSNRTITDLKTMLAMGINIAVRGHDDRPMWQVPVIGTSSETGQGIEELLITLEKHRHIYINTPMGAKRMRAISEYRTFKIAEDLLKHKFFDSTDERISSIVDQIARRDLDPYTASQQLLGKVAF